MGDEGTNVSMTELLEQAIEVMLQRVGGPLFGRVDSYTPATARASVVPLVPLWVDGVIVTPPKLHSVPVCWPGTVSHGLHIPLPAGAIVMLVPLGWDHSQWLTSGTPNVPPDSMRRLSLADLVAVPMSAAPMAMPPNPLSHDSTWAVLFGAWAIGGASAVKAAALHGDVVPPSVALAAWAVLVEQACNVAVPGLFTALNNFATTVTSTGAITATATKLKAE